jgi:hypothetical protein
MDTTPSTWQRRSASCFGPDPRRGGQVSLAVGIPRRVHDNSLEDAGREMRARLRADQRTALKDGHSLAVKVIRVTLPGATRTRGVYGDEHAVDQCARLDGLDRQAYRSIPGSDLEHPGGEPRWTRDSASDHLIGSHPDWRTNLHRAANCHDAAPGESFTRGR